MHISDAAHRYARQIQRFRFLIFLVWLLVFLSGLKWGLKFLDETTSEYTAPHSAASSVATRKLGSHFPSQKNTYEAVMLLSRKKDSDTKITTLTKPVELGLYRDINRKYGYNVSTPCDHCFIRSVQSYWLFEEYYGATQMGYNYLSMTANASIFVVTYEHGDSDKMDELLTFLDDHAKKQIHQNNLNDELKSGITGIESFAEAILDGVSEDLHIMDFIVLPIALMILASIIQSIPLMIIPVINIFTTILAEFLLMYPVALNMQVVSFTPSLMMSLTVAMSIDYSLFLLSRFMEEIKLGRSIEEAIALMIDGAGHTIVVSGGTLIMCFLGMLIFPMAMLQSVGIGASFALFFALSVNMTLTPAILFSIGKELVGCQDSMTNTVARLMGRPSRHSIRRISSSFDSKLTSTTNDLDGSLLVSNDFILMSDSVEPNVESSGDVLPTDRRFSADLAKEDMAMVGSCWYDLAWQTLTPRKGLAIVVVVVALCAPIASYCLDQNISISFELTVPEGSAPYNVFEDVSDDFGAGSVFPYKLVLVPQEDVCANDVLVASNGSSVTCAELEADGVSCGLFCESGFEAINHIMEELKITTMKHSTFEYTGITELDNSRVNFTDYQTAIVDEIVFNRDKQANVVTSFDKSLELLFASFCEIDDDSGSSSANLCASTYVLVELDKDPYSPKGVDWLVKARKTLDHNDQVLKGYLANGAGPTHDCTQAVYAAFPTIIIVTLGVVFVFIGVAFQSIVAPLRSVATLTLTLSFVYGLLVLTYEHGVFSWLNMRCLSNVGSTCWLPPVMCFSIIVGLGLDYDVFLTARIFEYRLNGYTDHAAAVKGIYKTGYIITAAGIIMAVAFGGLMTSTETILNQVSFLLVFAVLLDTFIVRTLCVPALLGMSDDKSWWPKTLPEATRDINY